ncbi:MAG TPA: amylo-alpha-1,6-glucosidase [Stellaceae bacterium]|jgi:glycogen debranching enzyme|nr:amylo-alpha-1,6-glucosidase [Stellaceae bacterium]
MAAIEPEIEEEGRFHIAATGSYREPHNRVLKHGNTFAVLDAFGDINGGDGNPDGLYHDDTRYLSRLELRLNGGQPLLLSSNPAEDSSLLSFDLANPDMAAADGGVLHRELIYINRRQFIWRAAYCELVLVRNYDQRSHDVTVSLRFAADFADIFEVRGQTRERRGQFSARRLAADTVGLRYRGLDGVERNTTLRFEPAPAELDTARALFAFRLGPGAWRRLALRVSCGLESRQDWGVRRYYQTLRTTRQEQRRSMARAARLIGSNPAFNELVDRSLADLYMLITETENGPYPFAGIPWYSTIFGRDGIITALLTLWLDPAIAKGVLHVLAATQSTQTDPARDAEPGKIVHEIRHGEMATLGEVPFSRYYGTVDATPLYVMLMGEYFARTGDLDTVRALWPNVQAALRWIDTDGDADGDGFIEYQRRSPTGLDNHGWKDSRDAIFHEDGRLADGPIALCEVQGYVYAAKRHAAILARALGDAAAGARLFDEAERLRRRFEAAFWCEDLATYALALDGEKRPCRVVASNAGHALWTGIADPSRAERVADTLLGAGCFSGWGIRTVARSAARFNPISYHNGSVWPHDNALIALGLSRYGLQDAALRVFAGLFRAASHWEPRRFPELFCGFARRGGAPTLYPVACSPQAWASACVFALVQASLGLRFDHAGGALRFEKPMLPPFLEHLHLRQMRLGEASADVMLHRVGGEVAATVTERHGNLRVVITH